MDGNSVSPLHGGPGRGIPCFSWVTSAALSGTLASSPFGLSSALFLFFLSFSFLLLQIHVSLTDWRDKWRSKSMWLSRLRQSDCKEGTTSHPPPQALKPVPAFTLPANPRETCPAPPFPGRPCCDKNQTSRSQTSTQGIFLPWSWPHLVWERKAICGSPGQGQERTRWSKAKRKIKEKFPGWLKGKYDQHDGDKWESHQPLPSPYSNSSKWYAYSDLPWVVQRHGDQFIQSLSPC